MDAPPKAGHDGEKEKNQRVFTCRDNAGFCSTQFVIAKFIQAIHLVAPDEPGHDAGLFS
jgi:hypothetical protein